MDTAHETRQHSVAIVAEDEALLRIETATILEDAGYTVLEAGDASCALELFVANGGDIGLLVTDIQMPGPLDGVGLAREVRTRWPEVEIVVVSAKERPGPDELPKGASFIDKPFDPKAILDVARAVSVRRAARGSA